MSILSEFKKFAVRGNVIDLAVGVIIGDAFGKIVSSLVSDIIMPPIGLLISGVRFDQIKLTIRDTVVGPNGQIIKQAVSLNAGHFIQTVLDFTIIAFSIFLMIKLINRLRTKQERQAETPKPTKEEALLTEIRDILKSRS